VYSAEQEWQTRSQLANGGNEAPLLAKEWVAKEWVAKEWMAKEWMAKEWMAKEWMAKECRLRTIPLLTIPLPEPAFCEVRDEAPQAPMVNPTV
jgi:hypothetical protein